MQWSRRAAGCSASCRAETLAARFADGALGVVIGTTTFHNDRPFARYRGGVTKRTEVNGASGSVKMIDDNVTVWKVIDSSAVPAALQPPARNVFQDFARWVQADAYHSLTLVKAEEARQALEIAAGIYASARRGTTIVLPLGSDRGER